MVASEKRHSGEVRICVEAALPASYLWRLGSKTPIRALTRQRAVMMFGKLRVWDTEHNNGVLIYVLLAEHAIEIVADRGLLKHVSTAQWQDMVAYLAAISLVIGNLLALVQSNLKRLLAYSTISHVGFLFMGLVSADNAGYSAAMFYAISYSVMTAAAFAAIITLSRKGHEAEEVSDFRGLWQHNPLHALMVLFVMASLAGIPPFLGFWAKLEVIKAALAGGYLWLAILSVVAAVVGAFYYLRIIRAMFFEEPKGEAPRIHPDNHLRIAFTINALGLLVMGVFAEPILHWCRLAFPV